jgi:hypothetical protein
MATGVTYNGVAMTQIGIEVEGAGNWFQTEIWGLANPTAGANNVVITWTHTGPDRAVIGITSYWGVASIGTPVTSELAEVTAVSVNLTTNPGDMCVDVCGLYATGTLLTPDAGQTERWDRATAWPNGAGSEKMATGTPTAMGWDWTTAALTCYVAIPLRAKGGGSPMWWF